MGRQKILYIQYTNPAAYPSLEHSSQILARHGWKVLFLGTGDWVGTSMRFTPHPNIEVRELVFCPDGWRQKFHYLWFCLWVIGWVIRWRPQWIYASDSLSCPLAWLLSHIPEARVIYHEHDSPVPTNGKVNRDLELTRYVLWFRRKLAGRVALCVLPSEKRCRQFCDEVDGRTKVLCVPNCPSREEVSPAWKESTKMGLWIYYHGSLNSERFPLSILTAVGILGGRVHLRVVGYETIGAQGYVQLLEKTAVKLGLEDSIEIFKSLPRHKLWPLIRACDVGLALMPKKSENFNFQSMVSASNKPFDYLAGGLALLVSNLKDWEEAYVEPGYGLMCDPEDPGSIADALCWFLEHPKEMREMGERGRRRVLTEWNYERQFALVLEELNREED